MTDDEVVAFDRGYQLGFRAGQLDGRRYALAVIRWSNAIRAGENIALLRGNISQEEYAWAVKQNTDPQVEEVAA